MGEREVSPRRDRMCKTSLMEWFEILGLILSGSIVGALLTWVTATRDLALRRRMQTMDTFLRISARAHGYRESGSDSSVGTGEQIAAMFLLADLANRDKWLRTAAVAQLDEELTWLHARDSEHGQRLFSAAHAAKKLVRE